MASRTSHKNFPMASAGTQSWNSQITIVKFTTFNSEIHKPNCEIRNTKLWNFSLVVKMRFALHLPAFNCEQYFSTEFLAFDGLNSQTLVPPQIFFYFLDLLLFAWKLEKAYKKWKAIKAVQMGIKRTKRWGEKNARNPQWAAKGLLTKLQDNCSVSSNINHGDGGDDKHFEGLCLPEKCIWTNFQI